MLTRDNLSKRQHIEDLNVYFMMNMNLSNTFLFGCIVARVVSDVIVDIFQFPLPNSMDDLCAMWPKLKMVVPNLSCVAALWSLRTMRNAMHFHALVWKDAQILLARVSALLRQWKIMCDDSRYVLLQRCLLTLDRRRGELHINPSLDLQDASLAKFVMSTIGS